MGLLFHRPEGRKLTVLRAKGVLELRIDPLGILYPGGGTITCGTSILSEPYLQPRVLFRGHGLVKTSMAVESGCFPFGPHLERFCPRYTGLLVIWLFLQTYCPTEITSVLRTDAAVWNGFQ
ncbi:hypothetical protein M422DRAFT_275350 [Sphaerobolus stellatus SS14]|uniref:Uncharacterized protein n=1 Tax=Sphaerobolus stellatus (strain SS14) TaxID=990650 RepID=A0A0C9UFM1_SPHS4|nr:hypothetical protein M422DRAFT_275350 [Sphaerobolus stellatus SS14]